MSSSGGLRRWLYRGGRPRRFAGFANRSQAVLAGAGLGPKRLVALEVRGWRSGRTVAVPVVVADVGHDRYLVSMLGEHSKWVRNVRAAHGDAVLHHRGRVHVHLEEVPPAERPPILRRYLECAPGARSHIPVDRRAPLDEFEAVASRYPVFRVRELPDG
jgi:deazaflavin-dependent oxidoreductase (nitroreductase family)